MKKKKFKVDKKVEQQQEVRKKPSKKNNVCLDSKRKRELLDRVLRQIT